MAAFIDKGTGERVVLEEGKVLTDFQGKLWSFLSVTGTSKIYVKSLPKDGGSAMFREFFPTVFGLDIDRRASNDDGRAILDLLIIVAFSIFIALIAASWVDATLSNS